MSGQLVKTSLKNIMVGIPRFFGGWRVGVFAVAGESSSWVDTIAGTANFQAWLSNLASLENQGSVGGCNITAMTTAGSFALWTSAAGLLPGFPDLATAKSFKDTVPNLLRYAMNLDTTGQGGLLPQPVVMTTDAGPALTLSYRQRKGMVDVALVPQYSNDLTNWTNVPATNIVQLADDDVNTARYFATMLLSAGQPLYLHVVAQPNNSPVTQWPVSAGGNGHYYQAIVGLGSIDFTYAQTYAVAQNGYIVTVTSAEENAFVFNLVNAPQFWMNSGGDLYGPLLGVTASGLPLQWVNNEGSLIYTNWATGKNPTPPNTYEGAQFFGPASTAPQPTWSPIQSPGRRGGSPCIQTSFVIEYDHNPAGN